MYFLKNNQLNFYDDYLNISVLQFFKIKYNYFLILNVFELYLIKMIFFSFDSNVIFYDQNYLCVKVNLDFFEDIFGICQLLFYLISKVNLYDDLLLR
jgi:hypothetical protein